MVPSCGKSELTSYPVPDVWVSDPCTYGMKENPNAKDKTKNDNMYVFILIFYFRNKPVRFGVITEYYQMKH